VLVLGLIMVNGGSRPSPVRGLAPSPNEIFGEFNTDICNENLMFCQKLHICTLDQQFFPGEQPPLETPDPKVVVRTAPDNGAGIRVDKRLYACPAVCGWFWTEIVSSRGISALITILAICHEWLVSTYYEIFSTLTLFGIVIPPVNIV